MNNLKLLFFLFTILVQSLFATEIISQNDENHQSQRLCYVSPMEDVAFESLMTIDFSNTEQKKQIISMLKAFTGVNITNILESKTQVHTGKVSEQRDSEKNKYGFMDCMCKTAEGYILIEVQVRKEAEWDKRALFYIAKKFVNSLKAGVRFDKLEDVIGVNILGFKKQPLLPEGSYKRDYRMYDVANTELKHSIPSLRLIQYEIPNITDEVFAKLPSSSEGGEKEWLSLFRMERKKEHERLPTNLPNIVKSASNRLSHSTWSDDQIQRYAEQRQFEISIALEIAEAKAEATETKEVMATKIAEAKAAVIEAKEVMATKIAEAKAAVIEAKEVMVTKIAEAKAEAVEVKAVMVKNMINKNMETKDIAEIANVDSAFVEQIRNK